LIFVDPGPLLENLIPDLSAFVSSATDDLDCMVYSTKSIDTPIDLSVPDSHVNVIKTDNDDLAVKLGIRVTPYALFVDHKGKLLAKGLVNNFLHLCVIIDMAMTANASEGLINISGACQPVLEEMKKNVQSYHLDQAIKLKR
jgi:hypothetical protein